MSCVDVLLGGVVTVTVTMLFRKIPRRFKKVRNNQLGYALMPRNEQHPRKTNMSPENQLLEDVFPIEIVPLGDMLVFGGVDLEEKNRAKSATFW